MPVKYHAVMCTQYAYSPLSNLGYFEAQSRQAGQGQGDTIVSSVVFLLHTASAADYLIRRLRGVISAVLQLSSRIWGDRLPFIAHTDPLHAFSCCAILAES